MHSTLFEILQRLGVMMELLLIESGSLLEHSSRIGWRSTVLFEVNEALAERQLARQLDKAQQIAAPTTTVAVEKIFASIDIEGRGGSPGGEDRSRRIRSHDPRVARPTSAAADNRAAKGAA
jgi:hypothetical protein